MSDTYRTLKAASEGLFKDRGSKFYAVAFPVRSEKDAWHLLEGLKKKHFKANHHCFAWRFGTEGTRCRIHDDGEPSGTAGRPILAQIDLMNLTDVMVVVIRYFGGTLLGSSGLINAYRESSREALANATFEEKVLKDHFVCDFEYQLMPDVVQGIKKLGIEIVHETFGDHGTIEIGIRKSKTTALMLQFKAALLKISTEEAENREWPEGITIKPYQT
jgi:uncharacterized YigZ family protein